MTATTKQLCYAIEPGHWRVKDIPERLRPREAMERMDRDWEALDALRVSLEETAADPTFELDPEMIDRLRSLGFK